MSSTYRKGLLLSFEGIDRAGKSTQVQKLAQVLRDELKLKVAIRHFPMYERPIGKFIGEVLNSDIKMAKLTPESLQMVYVADQLSYQDDLQDLLDNYDVVILDRYFMSTLVYGMGKGVLFDDIRSWQEGLIIPDATFVLNLPAEEVMARRGEIVDDVHESDTEFLRRNSELYKELSEQFANNCEYDKQIHYIDAVGDIDSIHGNILSHVKHYL